MVLTSALGYVRLITVTYGYGSKSTNRFISATYVEMNTANAKSVCICKHPASKIFESSLIEVRLISAMSSQVCVRSQPLRWLGLAPHGTIFARKWNHFCTQMEQLCTQMEPICTQMEPDLHANARNLTGQAFFRIGFCAQMEPICTQMDHICTQMEPICTQMEPFLHANGTDFVHKRI